MCCVLQNINRNNSISFVIEYRKANVFDTKYCNICILENLWLKKNDNVGQGFDKVLLTFIKIATLNRYFFLYFLLDRLTCLFYFFFDLNFLEPVQLNSCNSNLQGTENFVRITWVSNYVSFYSIFKFWGDQRICSN